MSIYVRQMLYIGVGAFLGANLRYAMARLLARWVVVGTFFVNTTGSLLLAIFLTWVSRRLTMPPEVRLLVATGFFGSYTTFSTFANEGVALARDGRWTSAALYMLGTNFVCVVGVLIGIWIGSRL